MIKTKLWPHQQKMVDWWLQKRQVIWGAEMGTGKTLAALAGMAQIKQMLFLVVTVKSALPVWQDEIAKHTNFPCVILDKGLIRKRVDRLYAAANNYMHPLIVVMNYEATFREPMRSALLSLQPEVIVCDESHRIGVYKSKTSKFLYELGKKASYKLAMTGTPFPNKPTNIFGQMRFIDPTVFGPYWTHFRRRYEIMQALPGQPGIFITTGFQNQQEFTEKLRPTLLQIKAEDVFNKGDTPRMPEVRDITIPVTPARNLSKLIKDFRKELILELNGGVLTADNALVKTLRLQQLSGGFVGEEAIDYSKVTALEEMIEGLGDVPYVVFAQFKSEIQAIIKRLQCAEFTGRTNELAEWLAGKYQGIVCQYQAGSLGVNMTRARHLFYYSPTYNLTNYEQSKARIRRPGANPDLPVYYYHLSTEGTLDKTVYSALQKKQSINEEVLRCLRKN